MGKNDSVLNMHLLGDINVRRENGHRLDLGAILNEGLGVVVGSNSGSLDSGPGSNLASSTKNRVEHGGIMLDLDTLENNRVLDSSTSGDHGTGTDGHVGAELGSRVDLGRGINVDRRHNVGRGSLKTGLLGISLKSLLQVKRVGGDSRASGLDLSPEVLGLVGVESVSSRELDENILLKSEVVLIALTNKRGILGLLFSHLLSSSDSVEDGLVEKVNTSIDQVGNVRLRLLNVMDNSLSFGVGNNGTKVVGDSSRDSGAKNDILGLLLLVELLNLLEGERTADISMDDEESGGVTLENDISEVVETTGSAHGLVLSKVLDAEVGVLLIGVSNELGKDRVLIKTNEENLLDILEGSHGVDCMAEDGLASNGEENLRSVQRQRSESSSSGTASNENKSLGRHFVYVLGCYCVWKGLVCSFVVVMCCRNLSPR